MPDSRFARLKSDPRFRRLRKKNTQLVVDDRFKGVLAQDKSKKKGRVDKYGRPASDNRESENLRRLYRLNNDESETPGSKVDYARGEVLLESSDEDQDLASSDDSELEDFENNHNQSIAISSRDDVEIDLDETNFTDLDAQAAAYNEAHSENAKEGTVPTRRIAIVNLDWEHVRASHLFKICSSLVSPTAPLISGSSQELVGPSREHTTKGLSGNVARGKVISVCVYPSEFGKQRMAREEIEGPPPEIFKANKHDDEEINSQNIYQIGDGEDYDKDALRNYQLERLRYYYAIVTCDTIDAATHIYMELEGTELERSGNIFDISYVPDNMTFDGKCRDETTDDPNTVFTGVDFVTDALRHSKVKLTWDEDDPERNHLTRRTLSRKEIDDGDFKVYLASSESEAEITHVNSEHKDTDKKASRDRLRALLIGGHDSVPEGWGPEDDNPGDVDMEVTFTPGLNEKARQDETTLEVYQRKIREKRKRKKEEVKKKAVESGVTGVEDDFFDIENDNDTIDDPKLNNSLIQIPVISPENPPTTSKEPVVSDNSKLEVKHFSLKSILKAEKKSRHKGKKRKPNEEDDNEIQADFAIDVKDERFKVLHEDHQYAIDPNNPHFKKTNSMKALLEERSKRQLEFRSEHSNVTAARVGETDKNLKSLVESVKRKSIVADLSGAGKRRRFS